jgi:hypothetical protein
MSQLYLPFYNQWQFIGIFVSRGATGEPQFIGILVSRGATEGHRGEDALEYNCNSPTTYKDTRSHNATWTLARICQGKYVTPQSRFRSDRFKLGMEFIML